jgi:hypothetical protein
MATYFKLERSSDGKMRRWAEGKMNPAKQYGAFAPCCGCCEGSYAIDGYVDGDLALCPECANDLGSRPGWDGTFISRQSEHPDQKCMYTRNPSTTYSIGGNPSKVMTEGSLQLVDETARTWRIRIACRNAGLGSTFLWIGEKTGGDADGVYARTGGCDTTSTLTIVKL